MAEAGIPDGLCTVQLSSVFLQALECVTLLGNGDASGRGSEVGLMLKSLVPWAVGFASWSFPTEDCGGGAPTRLSPSLVVVL